MDRPLRFCYFCCMNTEAWCGYADAEVLAKVSVRLIEPEEKARWDQLITERHYLKNAHLVGRQLRYVATVEGEWVALLGWNVAAYHLAKRVKLHHSDVFDALRSDRVYRRHKPQEEILGIFAGGRHHHEIEPSGGRICHCDREHLLFRLWRHEERCLHFIAAYRP